MKKEEKECVGSGREGEQAAQFWRNPGGETQEDFLYISVTLGLTRMRSLKSLWVETEGSGERLCRFLHKRSKLWRRQEKIGCSLAHGTMQRRLL
jgi:hypothetical protein